jgi:hypothetical protein
MITRLPELFYKDFWLKLFSLAMAILIWFTIFQAIQQQGSPVHSLSDKVKERTFYNLPVTRMSASSDVSGFKLNPDEVQVTVQGEAKNVDVLQAEEIKARVDLTGISANNTQRKRIEVSTPAGITHIKIEPADVEVVFPPKSSSPAPKNPTPSN